MGLRHFSMKPPCNGNSEPTLQFNLEVYDGYSVTLRINQSKRPEGGIQHESHMHCSFYLLVLGRVSVCTKWSDASSLWLAADQQNSVIQSREIMQAYIKHATAIARFHSQLGQKWKLAPSLGQHDIMTSISNCIPPLEFQFSSFLFSFSFSCWFNKEGAILYLISMTSLSTTNPVLLRNNSGSFSNNTQIVFFSWPTWFGNTFLSLSHP